MNPNLFESSLILSIAFLAVAAFVAVVSIVRGRRNSWVQSLPSKRIQDYPLGNVPPAHPGKCPGCGADMVVGLPTSDAPGKVWCSNSDHAQDTFERRYRAARRETAVEYDRRTNYGMF